MEQNKLIELTTSLIIYNIIHSKIFIFTIAIIIAVIVYILTLRKNKIFNRKKYFENPDKKIEADINHTTYIFSMITIYYIFFSILNDFFI